ncbi:hypothetical protein [Tumebacillus avium]|uniref:hypothetical protein n=1 Tax=Tumebacillus avium TaxID=1903704 RepID=UPI0018DF005C|nr:hypothetical protein [Tumebacillus avium]
MVGFNVVCNECNSTICKTDNIEADGFQKLINSLEIVSDGFFGSEVIVDFESMQLVASLSLSCMSCKKGSVFSAIKIKWNELRSQKSR